MCRRVELQAGRAPAPVRKRAEMKVHAYRFDMGNRFKSGEISIPLVGVLTLMVFSLQACFNYSPAFGVLYVVPVWAAVRATRLWGGLVLCAVAATLMTLLQCANNPTSLAQAVLDWFIRLGSFGVVVCLISMLETALEQANSAAFVDPLTGVLNRRALAQFAKRFLPAQAADVVIMIDCDGFKMINDRHGHQAGDHVLQILAKLLEAETRKNDMVVRMGGDEFAVILSDATLQSARTLLGRVEERFRDAMYDAGYECTVSIGIAEAEHEENLDHVLNRADQAMYRRKQNRRIDVQLN